MKGHIEQGTAYKHDYGLAEFFIRRSDFRLMRISGISPYDP
jgi:hypothetical protein